MLFQLLYQMPLEFEFELYIIFLLKSHNWFKCLFLEAFSLFANDNQNFNIYSKSIQSIKIYYQEIVLNFVIGKIIKKLLQIICRKERGEEKWLIQGLKKLWKLLNIFNNNMYFQTMKLSSSKVIMLHTLFIHGEKQFLLYLSWESV